MKRKERSRNNDFIIINTHQTWIIKGGVCLLRREGEGVGVVGFLGTKEARHLSLAQPQFTPMHHGGSVDFLPHQHEL